VNLYDALSDGYVKLIQGKMYNVFFSRGEEKIINDKGLAFASILDEYLPETEEELTAMRIGFITYLRKNKIKGKDVLKVDLQTFDPKLKEYSLKKRQELLESQK